MFELKLSTTGLFLEEIKQLFGALSQCNIRRSLEYIDISESCLWSEVRKDSTLIRQLFCFTQLQTLSLYFYGPIYLDNEFLLEAMSSWSHMRSLRLTDWSRCRQPGVTFGGLSAALRLCLHLHTLCLAVDAVNIDIDPEAEQFQHTSLKSLYLLSSPIEDAKVVARVVSLMFPCVDEVVANTEVIPTWIAVNDHLQSSKTSALLVTSQE
ncbi:hypothetical protein M405DRAFT_855957 [Rhizopogon salebrosus TDB-379]|nr:hypothetical protein M405DRAFT_855957 [Rhizopogon salebrosus TDB-379]